MLGTQILGQVIEPINLFFRVFVNLFIEIILHITLEMLQESNFLSKFFRVGIHVVALSNKSLLFADLFVEQVFKVSTQVRCTKISQETYLLLLDKMMLVVSLK